MQAVILAAGKGNRLYPLTQNRSKAMQPVLGMPIVGRVMENLLDHKIEDFILVVNPHDNQTLRYLHEEFPLPAKLQFSYQEQPLGTGDALKQAAHLITGSFLVSACDNLIQTEEVGKYLTHWKTSQSLNGLLTLMEMPKEYVHLTGIVELLGSSVTRIIEKPSMERAPSNIACLPLYIFSPQLLRYLDKLTPSTRGEYELQEAIQRLIDSEGKVQGFFVSHRLTLTRPSDLLKINRYYLKRASPPMKIVRTDSIGTGTRFIPPVYVEAGVTIGSDCAIGPEVYLEKGSHIGDRITLIKSICLQGTNLADGETVTDKVLSH